MFVIYAYIIALLVSPFLNGLLLGVLKKLTVSNNIKIFFCSYVRVVLLVAIVAACLAHFYKDIVMLSTMFLTGGLLFTFIQGPKYFVSSALSQQTVTMQYITSRFTKKTVVLPVEQITSTKLSVGKGWYNYPHTYTITFNDEKGKFYILNPITSNDYFYMIDNTEACIHQPADV